MLGAVAGAAVGTAIGANRWTVDSLTRDGMRAGAAAGARAHSQDFEREADLIGAEILAAAGIDFKDAIDFWRRIASEAPGSVMAAHGASHPSSPERFVRLQQLYEELIGSN